MFRVRFLGLLSFGALFFALAVFVACDNTTDDIVVDPITGVTVQAETLISGRGCGTATGQVFKYIAVVYGVDAATAADPTIPLSNKTYDVFQAANLYDCYSDGTFTNLNPSNGLSAYHLTIFAYDQADYLAAGGDQTFGGPGGVISNLAAAKLAEDNEIAQGVGNGSDYAAQIQQNLDLIGSKVATYSTVCRAEQLSTVQTLALCDPLTNGSPDAGNTGTITLPLSSFPAADGGVYACGTDYATVRVVATVNGAAGPNVATTACTASPLTIPMALAPASWSLALTLVKGDGTTLDTATCTTSTAANATATPTCTAP